MAAARQFLIYLRKHRAGVEATTMPDHVQGFLDHQLRPYRKRHGRLPRDVSGWRWGYTGGLHMRLRLAQGKWPPAPVPTSPLEQFRWELCDGYARWLSNARALAAQTIFKRRAEALRFLESLGSDAF